MPSGCIALVLHAHLPHVPWSRSEAGPEGRWLSDVATECYLPLVELLYRLFEEQVPVRLTLSLSPTLVGMLRDPAFVEAYGTSLERRQRVLAGARQSSEGESERARLLRFYERKLARVCQTWEAIEGDVVGALKTLEQAGVVELMTTAATHAFLPLVASPLFARLQVELGLAAHELAFGRRPLGFWLPECGYTPGLETWLDAAGVRYFIADTRSLEQADPPPQWGAFAPVACPAGRVACLGRHAESSAQLWSSSQGFPSHPSYRRSLTARGETEPALSPGNGKLSPDFFFCRGPEGEENGLYQPMVAALQARGQARALVLRWRAEARRYASLMGQPSLIVAPFDAELFGYRWFEGLWFLEAVFRQAAAVGKGLTWVTPATFLAEGRRLQRVQPDPSSWGPGGSAESWLGEDNAWVQRILWTVGRRLTAACREREPLRLLGLGRRGLEQALREYLLAQASDWLFLLREPEGREYAAARVRFHLDNARHLLDELEAGAIDESRLSELEQSSSPFREMDVLSAVWRSLQEMS